MRMTSARTGFIVALVVALLAGCTESKPQGGGGVGTGGARATGGRPGMGGSGTGGSGTGGSGTGGAMGSGGSSVEAGPPDGGDAPMEAAPDLANRPIQLKFTWWGGQERANATIKVIEMFEAANPDVNIDYEWDASTPYWAKLNGYAAAGTLPDIMQQDHKYIEEWSSKNQIIALDPHVADGTIDLSDVDKPLVDGGRVGGNLVALSLGTNTQTIAIDVDAFTRAGIAVPETTWTWEDFEKIAIELKTKLPGVWGHGPGLTGDSTWKGLYLSNGGWVFNPAGTALGYDDDAPWIDFLNMVKRLQEAGAIPTRAEAKMKYPSTDVATYPAVMGLAAMEHLSGSNLVVALWNAAEKAATPAGTKRTFKLLPIPRIKGKGSAIFIKPSQYLSITSASKHPKVAAKFLDFFTNSIAANEILNAERGVPIAKKVVAALKAKAPPPVAESFAAIERLAADARPLPRPDPAVYAQLVKDIYEPKVNDAVLAPPAGTTAAMPAAAVAEFRVLANALLSGGSVEGGNDGGVDGPADGGDGGDGPTGPRVAFIVGAEAEASDAAIKTRLEMKYAVDQVLDTMATAETATGKVLVVISASASEAGTMTKFRDVAVPVIVLEPNLFKHMNMTTTAALQSGAALDQTKLTVAPGALSALTAGLSGEPTVFSAPSRVTWGIPGGSVLRVATVVGAPTQVAIFAYPKDAAMVGENSKAPAKRIGFFTHNNAFANLNADGGKLFDAAVAWAVAP